MSRSSAPAVRRDRAAGPAQVEPQPQVQVRAAGGAGGEGQGPRHPDRRPRHAAASRAGGAARTSRRGGAASSISSTSKTGWPGPQSGTVSPTARPSQRSSTRRPARRPGGRKRSTAPGEVPAGAVLAELLQPGPDLLDRPGEVEVPVHDRVGPGEDPVARQRDLGRPAQPTGWSGWMTASPARWSSAAARAAATSRCRGGRPARPGWTTTRRSRTCRARPRTRTGRSRCSPRDHGSPRPAW